MTLRILVLGRTGQVAQELARANVPDLSIQCVDRREADLSDPAGCARYLTNAPADIIVNAAAFTDVDDAERNMSEAVRVNADSPALIAAAAAQRSIPLIHLSTDYVFGGPRLRPWTEEDKAAPCNVYGRSKLAGEHGVLAAGGQPVVLRTSWVHSAHGRSFVGSIIAASRTRKTLRVVDDQTGCPTAAHDVAHAVLRIARSIGAGNKAHGVFHFCGDEPTTWFGFAEEIFASGFSQQRPILEPISSDAWPSIAARPVYSALDCRKIKDVFGIPQPDWKFSLRHVLSEMQATAA